MAIAGIPAIPSAAADELVVTVHKSPNCGCCTGWMQHLQKGGFTVKAIDTDKLSAVKARLGVPGRSRGLPHRQGRRLCHRGVTFLRLQ